MVGAGKSEEGLFHAKMCIYLHPDVKGLTYTTAWINLENSMRVIKRDNARSHFV